MGHFNYSAAKCDKQCEGKLERAYSAPPWVAHAGVTHDTKHEDDEGEVNKSYVIGNSIHNSFNRGTTIHGVHYLRVTHNPELKLLQTSN